MPSPGKNPDRLRLRREGSRWPRRLALATLFVCLTLAVFSPPPASAQGSTIASEPSVAKHEHHAKKKPASGTEQASAKEGGAGGSSADDNGSPFALTASKGPINIQSDTLSLDYKGKAVLFTGHVHAIQSGSQLTSDTLHVNYEQNFKDVKDMVAEGNVRISQGTRWSTSDHAVMNQKDNTVVLTGHPIVHDGPDQITGSRITVHLNTGQSVVENASAKIFPRQSQTPDNGASGAAAAAADQSTTAADPATAGEAADDSPAPAVEQAPGH